MRLVHHQCGWCGGVEVHQCTAPIPAEWNGETGLTANDWSPPMVADVLADLIRMLARRGEPPTAREQVSYQKACLMVASWGELSS